jgi:hypothetical protein
MKILIVECTAEELRANRTVMDSLTEALSGFTRSLAGVSLTKDQVAEALARAAEDEEQEEEN